MSIIINSTMYKSNTHGIEKEFNCKLKPGSSIDPEMHQSVLKKAFYDSNHYTKNLDYFMELVRELGDAADEFDFKNEMDESIYNSNTFEYLVSENFYVIVKVPENLLTRTMIDLVIQNCSFSYSLLCEHVMEEPDKETCEKILDKMIDFDFDERSANAYEFIIQTYPDLKERDPCLHEMFENQRNGNDQMNEDDETTEDQMVEDDPTYDEYNRVLDVMNRRKRTESESLMFQNSMNEFLKEREIESIENSTCIICFGNMNVSIKLDCEHMFCKECISNWIKYQDKDLRLQKNCPCCRKIMEIKE